MAVFVGSFPVQPGRDRQRETSRESARESMTEENRKEELERRHRNED